MEAYCGCGDSLFDGEQEGTLCVNCAMVLRMDVERLYEENERLTKENKAIEANLNSLCEAALHWERKRAERAERKLEAVKNAVYKNWPKEEESKWGVGPIKKEFLEILNEY